MPIPLLLLLIVIAFPVAIPIALALHLLDRRRLQSVAKITRCERCGAMLGVAALDLADTKWAKRADALQRTGSIMRLRLIRRLWAICAACGAEYDYDFRARTFHRLARTGLPDDEGTVSAS